MMITKHDNRDAEDVRGWRGCQRGKRMTERNVNGEETQKC